MDGSASVEDARGKVIALCVGVVRQGENVQVEAVVIESFEFSRREEAGVAGLVHEKQVAGPLKLLDVSFRPLEGSIDVCKKVADGY